MIDYIISHYNVSFKCFLYFMYIKKALFIENKTFFFVFSR